MPQPGDQVYVNRVSHADCVYLNTVGLKWCFTPGVFLPEIHNLALIMKRTLKKKSSNGETCYKTCDQYSKLSGSPKTGQV